MKINILTIVITAAMGVGSSGYAGSMDKKRCEAEQINARQQTQNAEFKAATERCYTFYGYGRQHCLVEARIRYRMK